MTARQAVTETSATGVAPSCVCVSAPAPRAEGAFFLFPRDLHASNIQFSVISAPAHLGTSEPTTSASPVIVFLKQ